MINFIKNLLGLNKPTETVKEILTPQVDTAKVSTYIEPAKPVVKTNKVKAISVPATAANTKPKAKPVITEGNTKGGNGVVKQQPKQTNKPNAPQRPKAKRK